MLDTILSPARERMKHAIEITRTDLSSIRSGRATSALVENIMIKAYGGTQRLKVMEMATITASDAKSILITPFDPSQTADIEKGIQEANTGLNPVTDGDVIRISIPPLSEERRLEFVKLVKTKIEGGRIMVRQVRQEGMKDLKNALTDKTITEDDKKHGERLVQELTDEMIAELDMLGEKKEQELMQV